MLFFNCYFCTICIAISKCTANKMWKFLCYLSVWFFFLTEKKKCAIILFVTNNYCKIVCNQFKFVGNLWFILKLFSLLSCVICIILQQNINHINNMEWVPLERNLRIGRFWRREANGRQLRARGGFFLCIIYTWNKLI